MIPGDIRSTMYGMLAPCPASEQTCGMPAASQHDDLRKHFCQHEQQQGAFRAARSRVRQRPRLQSARSK
ncbi:hypothetical protein Micbo1qcDRAFT_51245 [Microdochium bolleyi]|uniref:Uncharacterized protein n=1 Tax=Microdochium bolleyi TaxID=196109 RepID=A0A136J6N1_9PEZI|nr:hypothetical protein Micbo1qcDRAFT_51245 [Microdochium bolleyi]